MKFFLISIGLILGLTIVKKVCRLFEKPLDKLKIKRDPTYMPSDFKYQIRYKIKDGNLSDENRKMLTMKALDYGYSKEQFDVLLDSIVSDEQEKYAKEKREQAERKRKQAEEDQIKKEELKKKEEEERILREKDPFAENMIQIPGGTFSRGVLFECDPYIVKQDVFGHPGGDKRKKSVKIGTENVTYNWKYRIQNVEVSPFKICKYEVTQKQWINLMGQWKFGNCGDDLPATNVSWFDVKGFIQKANEKWGTSYRLPTSAEWRIAACGGAGERAEGPVGGGCWSEENSSYKIHKVGQLLPNEFGLYDMAGNVEEWVEDGEGLYQREKENVKDPKGPDKPWQKKMVAGGCYRMDEDHNRYSSFGDFVDERRSPSDEEDFIGFRLVSD